MEQLASSSSKQAAQVYAESLMFDQNRSHHQNIPNPNQYCFQSRDNNCHYSYGQHTHNMMAHNQYNSSGMLSTVRNNQRIAGLGPATGANGKIGNNGGNGGIGGNSNAGGSGLAKFTSVVVGNNSTRHSKTSSFVFV